MPGFDRASLIPGFGPLVMPGFDRASLIPGFDPGSQVFLEFSKKLPTFAFPNRGVEQSVARRAHNPEVVGSSPASATKHNRQAFQPGIFCLGA